MITFINEDLMAFKPQVFTNRHTNKESYNLLIRNSLKVTQPIEPNHNSGGKYVRYTESEVKPQTRDILKITAPFNSGSSEEFESFVADKLHLSNPTKLTLVQNKYTNKVILSSMDSGYRTTKNYFVVAIPFSGKLKTIPRMKGFDIVSGIIMSSATHVRRYNRILYLTICVDDNKFKDSELTADDFVLTVDAYRIYRNRETGNPNTARECTTIKFASGGNYTQDVQKTTLDGEHFIVNNDRQMFTISIPANTYTKSYNGNNRNDNNHGGRQGNNDAYNKPKRDDYSNKNDSVKQQQRPQPNVDKAPPQRDIIEDFMLESSNDGKYGGKKSRQGKRGKNRHTNDDFPSKYQ